MQSSVLQGILLPFWGTSLGAACVFCLQRAPSAVLRRVLEGFAAGVMTAASVWSLLLPAIDWADMGRWSFLPAAGGFWLGCCSCGCWSDCCRRLLPTVPPP